MRAEYDGDGDQVEPWNGPWTEERSIAMPWTSCIVEDDDSDDLMAMNVFTVSMYDKADSQTLYRSSARVGADIIWTSEDGLTGIVEGYCHPDTRPRGLAFNTQVYTKTLQEHEGIDSAVPTELDRAMEAKASS